MQDALTETQTMPKLSEYAKQLLALTNEQRPTGRQFLPKRTGSVLAGKSQTGWEIAITKKFGDANKDRWATLFAKPLNKWKPQS
jgi:hypothetical protein